MAPWNASALQRLHVRVDSLETRLETVSVGIQSLRLLVLAALAAQGVELGTALAGVSGPPSAPQRPVAEMLAGEEGLGSGMIGGVAHTAFGAMWPQLSPFFCRQQ